MTDVKKADRATGMPALVGDVGGTHARFALADLSGATPKISAIREYPSRDYKSAGDALRAYFADQALAAPPPIAAIAAAGPIAAGTVHFTNLGWSLSEADLLSLGFKQARLLNDFEVLALATPYLGSGDLHELGGARAGALRSTVAVIGPGTGFGASALVRDGAQALAMTTEGGHASFAPSDDVEREILRLLTTKFDHVSTERLLSGPGLQNLHWALAQIDGVTDEPLDPTEITRRALARDAACLRTVRRFCAILGSTAGDFALYYGARGGVYIAGGIAPSILSLLEQSEFRIRFEAKGRFDTYLRAIPTRVITYPHAAFLGAAVRAEQLAHEG